MTPYLALRSEFCAGRVLRPLLLRYLESRFRDPPARSRSHGMLHAREYGRYKHLTVFVQAAAYCTCGSWKNLTRTCGCTEVAPHSDYSGGQSPMRPRHSATSHCEVLRKWGGL